MAPFSLGPVCTAHIRDTLEILDFEDTGEFPNPMSLWQYFKEVYNPKAKILYIVA